jgi:hypothetical protein
MKKESKQYVVNGLSLLIALAFFGVTYVSVKLQCESLVKEKLDNTQALEELKNARCDKTAQYQGLSSEENIRKAAMEHPLLKMENGKPPVMRLYPDRLKIDQIQKEIDSKYE